MASILFSAPQNVNEKSNEENSHENRKNAKMTVATFIINCFT